MRAKATWLGPVLVALAAAAALEAPAAGQVYRPGLLALYADFAGVDVGDPPRATVRRVDTQPWFYQVPVDVAIGEFRLSERSEFPWPEEVVEQLDWQQMVVLWVGYLFIPEGGRYDFEILADDGAMLTIDDQEVVVHAAGFAQRRRGRWRLAEPTRGGATLASGFHSVSLIYSNQGPVSGVFLRWRPPGADGYERLPSTALLHDPEADPLVERPDALEVDDDIVSSGTGFVVHPDGWVLTCHHVVSGGGTPTVRVGDDDLPAIVVGSDPRHDLALLKVEAADMPTVRLAGSEAVGRQDEVLCFGYPLASLLGLALSVENGRITAIREMDGNKVLQTNAPINFGNSGGPMVDLRGDVVGVVNARLELRGAPQGVAFAVPVEYALPLLRRIPEFTAEMESSGEMLTPAEVDRRVHRAVLPVLMYADEPAGDAPRPTTKNREASDRRL